MAQRDDTLQTHVQADETIKHDKPQLSFEEDLESTRSGNKPEDDTERDALPYSGTGTAGDRALVFKQDLRIIPLCAFIYLLCYLDRSNIGNAKVLNEDTGNDVSHSLPLLC